MVGLEIKNKEQRKPVNELKITREFFFIYNKIIVITFIYLFNRTIELIFQILNVINLGFIKVWAQNNFCNNYI